MITGTIRYWAAAKDAAGVAEERWQLGSDTDPAHPAAVSLAELLADVRARHADNSRFLRVLDRSSVLVDERAAGTRAPEDVILTEASVVEVLPPFAGGCL